MSGRPSRGGCRLLALGLVAAAPMASAPAHAGGSTIEGTIRVEAALAGRIGPGDRLVIKLFHPGDGVELDAKYQLIDDFSLPLDFIAGPSVDMSGRTKFSDYVIEVFTDKDRDVLRVAPGELGARTPGPVPLGTSGLVLELDQLRE